MGISATVKLDSVSPQGARLTTMEVRCHRYVLSEFNTHRVFSRNSASSRAIPVRKTLERVQADPAIPAEWGKTCRGMSAHQEVDESTINEAMDVYNSMLSSVLDGVSRLNELGIHKQVANRFLEPFSWHTIVVTATNWDNFFAQRCHPDAQPEIRILAEKMKEAYDNSTPVLVNTDDYHTPYILPCEYESLSVEERIKISIARCARVSYLTHDGKRDISEDLKLYDRLASADPPHHSPFEHVATPGGCSSKYDNFQGWKSERWALKNTLYVRSS
jgi:thymidylate synthase ThyX